MGIDIRYLVVTLVAVFLALALGTFYGAGLTNEPSVKELSTTINQLNESFEREKEKLRLELKQKEEAEEKLRTQLETNDSFFRASLPHLIHQRLLDKRIAVVHTTTQSNFPSLQAGLTKRLEQAGAIVASVTVINADLEEADGSVLQRLAQAYQIAETDEQNIWIRLSQIAAKAIALGDTANVISHFHKAKLLVASGDYTQPVNGVIVVGGDDDENSDVAQRVDVPLLKTLRGLNVTCVGCETSEVSHSFIEDYQRVDRVSTVDNVNTQIGQAAMILTLSGYSGHCGTKATASRLLPAAK
jgi:hypothetical protein